MASVVNWVLFFAVSMYLHGDALGTLPSKDGFVVRSHGQFTPVSQSVWLFSLLYSGATLLLTPAIWIAVALRAFSGQWRHAQLFARFGIPIFVVLWCIAWYWSLGGSFRSSAQDWLDSVVVARTGSAGRVRESSGDRNVDFIRAVLGDTEDFWDERFRALGGVSYPRVEAVLVSGSVMSACGAMDVASGPRYCAGDQRIYVNATSLGDLARRSGDFAAAYLLVHEVGRHVQTALDAQRTQDVTTNQGASTRNAQVRVPRNLQADCYVGVWTYSVLKRGLMEPREVDSGSSAAMAVEGVPKIVEDIAERGRWFKQGLATGDPRTCDR